MPGLKHTPTIEAFIERMPRKPYCSDDLSEGLIIRPKKTALRKKFVQHSPPPYQQAIVVDIDHDQAFCAHEDALVQPPSLLVRNPDTGHAHALYLLKTPVAIGPDCRMRPQRWLAGIERGYCRRLGGDRGYSGLIVRNPLRHPLMDWGLFWELEQLDAVLDFEDKAPYREPRHEHGLGRNVTMFDIARHWAYRGVIEYASHESFHAAVLDKCRAINAEFSVPLRDSECRATAKSIAKWTWARRDDFAMRKLVNRGRYGCSRAEAGKMTGQLRAAETAAKIELAIRTLVARGKRPTVAAIATLAGVSRPTVYSHFAKHGRP